MDVEKAKPLVEEFIRSYLMENECVYPSDVADGLGLEYELVRQVFAVLEKEEKLCKQCE
ncbi:MAG: hypothetical protein JSW14_02440 [Candidatus Bathyarchaeum sp.]|nr:MAG: hypothetical protein JSW14_02440 [Candidatus Bathyarchaeum sp.]